MRQLTPAEIANLLGRAIQSQAQFYVARSSGGQPGQFLRVNGVQARIMEPVPPGQVILVRYGDEWRAYAPRNPAPVVRVVQDVRRRQVVPEVVPLPFAVVLIVDASGSLDIGQIPSVFEALDIIKANLVSISKFRSASEINRYILLKTEEGDERYLRWYREFSIETGQRRVVIVNFQDETDAAYSDSAGLSIGALHGSDYYASDLISFSSFMTEGVELLGAKTFVPRAISNWEPGLGVSDEDVASFLNASAPIDSHLEYVFLDPEAGGYPLPPLSSFMNRYDMPVMEYELLIRRDLFTVTYVYNKIAEYLNVYLALSSFKLLPLLPEP